MIDIIMSFPDASGRACEVIYLSFNLTDQSWLLLIHGSNLRGHCKVIEALLSKIDPLIHLDPFLVLIVLLSKDFGYLEDKLRALGNRSHLHDDVKALGRNTLKAVLSNPKTFDIRKMCLAAAGTRDAAVAVKYHTEVTRFLDEWHGNILQMVNIEAWSKEYPIIGQEYKTLEQLMTQHYQYYVQISAPRTQTQFEAVSACHSIPWSYLCISFANISQDQCPNQSNGCAEQS